MEENGPLIVDGEKIIMPAGLQKKVVEELHANTHGSFRRMKEMIQMIQDIVDRCEACKRLQPSKSEGAQRLDKIPLTSLSPHGNHLCRFIQIHG